MYIKDFDKWNEKQKKINSYDKPFYFNEGEVWWCSVGVNIGIEQDGKGRNFDRPVVVLKRFNRDALIIVLLTGRRKDGDFYLYLGKIGDSESSANLSQIRSIDARRLIEKIDFLDPYLFSFLKFKVKLKIFSENNSPPQLRGAGHEADN